MRICLQLKFLQTHTHPHAHTPRITEEAALLWGAGSRYLPTGCGGRRWSADFQKYTLYFFSWLLNCFLESIVPRGWIWVTGNVEDGKERSGERWHRVVEAPGGGSNPTLAKSRGPALAASPLPLPLTEWLGWFPIPLKRGPRTEIPAQAWCEG